MAAAVDRYLDQLQADDAADRRNGYYRRHLLAELGDIELNVPRTRRYSPTEVIRAYARRTREIDRVILAGFVLGLSTRKVGETLLALLGRTGRTSLGLAALPCPVCSFFTGGYLGWPSRLARAVDQPGRSFYGRFFRS
jgi:hypothetical protein